MREILLHNRFRVVLIGSGCYNFPKMKKLILVVAAGLLLVGLAGVVLGRIKSPAEAPEVSVVVGEELVGGEQDEHGCLGSAGYTWCEAKQKCLREWEEPCEETELSSLLSNLSQETGIAFSAVTPTTFPWFTAAAETDSETPPASVTLRGEGIEAMKIGADQAKKVEEYLTDRSWVIDLNNVSAGTISGGTGYQKEDLACLIIEGASGFTEAAGGQWTPPNPALRDVIVNCAFLESRVGSSPEE